MAIKNDYERLKDTDLVKENKMYDYLLGDLLKEKKQLEKENKELKKENKDLKAEIIIACRSTKEFIKERTSGVKEFKSSVRNLMTKIQDKTTELKMKNNYKETKNEFVEVHKKDLLKEKQKDRGMEL